MSQMEEDMGEGVGATGAGMDLINAGANNQMAQSRESFEDNSLNAKELQIKRQYIDELRRKLTNLVDENHYLKGDLANAGGLPDQHIEWNSIP